MDREHESPSSSPAPPMSGGGTIYGTQNMDKGTSQEHAKNAAAAAQAHFNGTSEYISI